jgi:hypothetical protein
MKKSKLNILKDYDTLEKEQKESIKRVYPKGFNGAIIEFTNTKNKTVSAIRWETKDKIYMLRLSNKMLEDNY